MKVEYFRSFDSSEFSKDVLVNPEHGLSNVSKFVAMVEDMRRAQKDYFRTRSPSALNKSKQLEKHVDDVIEGWKYPNLQGDLL